ncbi:swr complex subunit [Apophysomyces sp. BC1034]|nr:swr complex subunit [Apophysomyces sp. BC1015]KAG0178827.1 swr complex subunit [Apophysomyces sp. BC1021]KAG0185185.1 swr complex subunit [Apophysomyces sp. BC1034]
MSGSDIRDILQITKSTESSPRRLKQANEKRPDYAFARFNKVTDVIEYTEEEYSKYLSDSDWTKEETDYFFRLCRQYDLRFPVIEDRYDCGMRKRTIEDLKDRYYSIYRKLLKERPLNGQAQERQALIQQYGYDKTKEVERKKALVALFNRTKEQMDEEETLMIEAKRIEANEIRLAKERENLLSSLQLEQLQGSCAPGSLAQSSIPAPSVIGITGTTTGGSPAEKKKKKQQEENASSRKGQKAVVEATPKEKLTPGVYVRSQRLPNVKPTMQQKVLKVLEELSVGTRPVMPTAQVCHKFDALQNSILNMFELKKVVDKMEMEHKVKQSTTTNRKRSSSTAGSGHREKRRA